MLGVGSGGELKIKLTYSCVLPVQIHNKLDFVLTPNQKNSDI